MDYEILIIGAGVVGLACAEAISSSYVHNNQKVNILLIDRHDSFGQDTSSRNSEVIHAGIYYPPNSLKAELCTKGNLSIREWCDRYNIDYRLVGKYIIAVDESELDNLQRIYSNGVLSGAKDLKIMEGAKINGKEPNLNVIRGIYSPNTGIFDSHRFMESLEYMASKNGADIVYRQRIKAIDYNGSFYECIIEDKKGNISKISTEKIINAAGLHSDKVAEMVGIDIEKNEYKLSYCKGNYFRIKSNKSNLVNSLIYPVPPARLTSLGIHITNELNGSLRLGPDVEYMEENLEEYNIDLSLDVKFHSAVSRYLNNLEVSDLYPDYCGIRPKLQKKGGEFKDFIIKDETDNGYKGFINLIGIDSPGLTSSLEIGKYVKDIIRRL